MYGYRRSSWEDAVAGEVSVLAVVLVILAVAVLVTLAVAAAKEIGRLIRASTGYSERTKRIMWLSLAGFAGVLLLSGLATLLVPGLAAACIYLDCWGFLVFVAIIEGCDWYERRMGRGEQSPLGDLETYLDFTPHGDAGFEQTAARETSTAGAA